MHLQSHLVYPTLVYLKTLFIQHAVGNHHHYSVYVQFTLIYVSNTWFIQHLVHPTPGLSNTWFIQHLVYPTPGLPNTWFIQHLVYPTPGLSDTFHEEQTWSDKPGSTVHTYVHTYIYHAHQHTHMHTYMYVHTYISMDNTYERAFTMHSGAWSTQSCCNKKYCLTQIISTKYLYAYNYRQAWYNLYNKDTIGTI